MKYEAVVFDLDGTLADTLPLTVFALKEAVRLIEGKELRDEEVLQEFGPVDTDIVKVFVREEKHLEAQELYVKIFQDYFNEYVKPISGIKELLEFLNFNGVKVGLFTGRGMRVTKIIIDQLGINDYFKTVISGELTKKPKPDPEGINIALKNLGVNSSKNIYVGDFDVDILASRAAGTLSVLALWSSTGSDKLIELKPDKFFKTPYEFIDWLKK
jgi:pyrophosphatase PpaX